MRVVADAGAADDDDDADAADADADEEGEVAEGQRLARNILTAGWRCGAMQAAGGTDDADADADEDDEDDEEAERERFLARSVVMKAGTSGTRRPERAV
jgi:hypothetical protein